MEKTDTRPEDFIASLPEDRRGDVKRLDAEISKVMRGLPRVMWEGVFWGGTQQKIIGYGDLEFVGSNKKVTEWFIIGLSLQKKYMSIYVSAVDANGYLAENHKAALGKAKVGKSSISFARLEDIDLGVLLSLIEKARDLSVKVA